MGSDGIYYIDQPACIAFEGDGVRLDFTSGGKVVTLVMARSKFRNCVENGLRALNEADREDQAKIASFKCG